MHVRRSIAMGKCVFFMGWIQKEEYKNWIAADRMSKSKARCRICNKSFDVASMGEAALQSHMKGKKHTHLMGLKPKENLFLLLFLQSTRLIFQCFHFLVKTCMIPWLDFLIDF